MGEKRKKMGIAKESNKVAFNEVPQADDELAIVNIGLDKEWLGSKSGTKRPRKVVTVDGAWQRGATLLERDELLLEQVEITPKIMRMLGDDRLLPRKARNLLGETEMPKQQRTAQRKSEKMEV